MFVVVFGLISIVLLAIIIYKLRWSRISIGYIFLFLIVPLVFEIVFVYKADHKKKYTQASNWLKLIMLSGMIYMLIAAKWVL